MKRFLVLIFTFFLGLALLTDSAFSAPRSESYRSAATAGMVKSEYDRLSDNPAYVGMKLNYLEYNNSITKGKTNIFTVADGLNDDGRFIAGGIGDPGFGFIGGIGGYVELGINTNPYNCSYNTGAVGPNNLQINFGGQYEGSAEGSAVYYDDTIGGDEYDQAEVLTAKEEYYNKDSHANAKIAAGGIQVGDMTFGASFERNTDSLNGASTGETTRKGGYSYTQEDIIQDLLLYSESRSFDQSYTVSPVNYLLTLGGVIPIGGFIEVIEAMVMVNYLQNEIKEDNSEKSVTNDPGVLRTTNPGNSLDGDAMIYDSQKQDGLQYGLGVLTREKLFGFNASTFVYWISGGLTPNKERTTVYKDYNTADNYSYYYPGNPGVVDSGSVTGTYKYSGGGISANTIIAGITLRKNFTESLAGGVGFSYTIYMSENKYTRKAVYKESYVVNDGDGVADNNDYTETLSGSYTDKFTDTETTQVFTMPIGFEYQATPTLCWRMGVIHTTMLTKTSSKWERGKVRDLYDDYDYADIPGNETDSDDAAVDGHSSSESVGSFVYDTTERSRMEKRTYNTQNNDYFFGIGYSVEKCVQIDVLLTSNDEFAVDAGYISMSATYVVQ